MSAGLSELQTLFQKRLTTGAHDIDAHLTGGGPFMTVYDRAYVVRLQEILGEDFPGIHTLLGDEAFAEATRDYIAAHPSRFPSVRWLGHMLAAWLADTEPWRDQPVLADMARFEWTLGLAFDAPDVDAIGIEALSGIPPEAWPLLCFDLHPAFSVTELVHDVTAFQQAVARGEEPVEAPQPFEAPTMLAAWRETETLTIRYRSLSREEARGLAVIREGGSFTDLCEAFAEVDAENAAALAAGHLRGWIEAGWITGVFADGLSLPVREND